MLKQGSELDLNTIMQVAKPVQQEEQKKKDDKHWHCRDHDRFTRFSCVKGHTSKFHQGQLKPEYFECKGDICIDCKGKYR